MKYFGGLWFYDAIFEGGVIKSKPDWYGPQFCIKVKLKLVGRAGVSWILATFAFAGRHFWHEDQLNKRF